MRQQIGALKDSELVSLIHLLKSFPFESKISQRINQYRYYSFAYQSVLYAMIEKPPARYSTKKRLASNIKQKFLAQPNSTSIYDIKILSSDYSLSQSRKEVQREFLLSLLDRGHNHFIEKKLVEARLMSSELEREYEHSGITKLYSKFFKFRETSVSHILNLASKFVFQNQFNSMAAQFPGIRLEFNTEIRITGHLEDSSGEKLFNYLNSLEIDMDQFITKLITDPAFKGRYETNDSKYWAIAFGQRHHLALAMTDEQVEVRNMANAMIREDLSEIKEISSTFISKYPEMIEALKGLKKISF